MDNRAGISSAESLDSLIHDLKECKYSLEMLLSSLAADMQHLDESKMVADWPAIFNSLRIASTNFISISKSVRDKKEFVLKTSLVLPLQFSEDVDPELQEMTNHRISVFNQDVIPHILRTKLIPALEDEENGLQQVGKEFEQSNKTFDKVVNNFKKSIDDCSNLVEKPKRELDSNKSGTNVAMYNLHETLAMMNYLQNGGRPRRAN